MWVSRKSLVGVEVGEVKHDTTRLKEYLELKVKTVNVYLHGTRTINWRNSQYPVECQNNVPDGLYGLQPVIISWTLCVYKLFVNTKTPTTVVKTKRDGSHVWKLDIFNSTTRFLNGGSTKVKVRKIDILTDYIKHCMTNKNHSLLR